MPVVVGVLKETAANETRVALTPEIAGKLKGLGARVLVERGAGTAAQFTDNAYGDAELTDAPAILSSADILLCVQPPSIETVNALKPGAVVAGFMQAYARQDLVRALKERRTTSFAMELVPRISRAQSMDALSSQATVSGYRAALAGASYFDRFFPLLTTAAGTIRPAKVLVMGVGVAGLQAIATSKRLGARVRAYDPESIFQARAIMPEITYCSDAYDCAKGAHALVIVTEWDQFRALDFVRLGEAMAAKVVIDLRNIYRPADVRRRGFKYVGVGLPNDAE